MIIHYVEDEQDVAGWGLFLRHVRGDSDTRAYIGCHTPEEAVSIFLKESEAFSRDDILEVTPIWDYRAFRKAEEWKSHTCGECKFWAYSYCFVDNLQKGEKDARWWNARACEEFVLEKREIPPIWDYRAFKKASVMEQTQSRRLEKEHKGAMS